MVEKNKFRFLKYFFLFFLVSLFLFSGFKTQQNVLADDLEVIFSVPAICGNGIKEGSEECDDGNLNDGDGCSSVCKIEATNCFAAGTKILMADGKEKNIEEIVSGDLILSYDFVSNKLTTTTVGGVWSGPHDDNYLINENIYVTSEHPFWTIESGWVAIDPNMTLSRHNWLPQQLKIGDHLLNSWGQAIEIFSIEEKFGEIQTYNLINIEKYNNYFANGVLVHNKSGDTTSPVIDSVVTNVNQTNAEIKWKATDNVLVTSVIFEYGLTGYDQNIPVSNLGNDEYKVNISGLTADTKYIYKITVIDSSNNAAIYTGDFTTSAIFIDQPPVFSNVVTSTSYFSALINWVVSDDQQVSSLTFEYGLNSVYGLAESITINQNNQYSKTLLGLSKNSIYGFRIVAKDNINQETVYLGTFQTLDQDDSPPIISNIVVVPGVDSALLTWNTNELASSQVLYGLTGSYGSSALDSNFVLNHNLPLLGLLPNTLYNFQVIATDQLGNQASSTNQTFTTLKDDLPPSNVSNLNISIVNNSGFKLVWDNPLLIGNNFDFKGVKILRKIGSFSTNPNEGILVYEGSGNSFVDNNVLKNTNYYYTVFSYDTSGNFSSGVSVNSLIATPVVPPVSNFNLEVLTNSISLTWTNPSVSNFTGVKILRKIGSFSTNPNEGILVYEGSGNSFVDNNIVVNTNYYYTIFSYNNVGEYSSGVWRNGQLIYVPPNCADNCSLPGCCNDPVCSKTSVCHQEGAQIEICNDGLDNDGDGFIDCEDSDCKGFSGCVEQEIDQPPADSFSSNIKKIDITDLIFLVGNKKIKLTAKNNIVSGLSNFGLLIGLKQDSFEAEVKKLSLKILQANYQFIFDENQKTYYTNLSFPLTGQVDAYLEIDYGEEIGKDIFNFKLNSLPFGKIFGEDKMLLSGAKIVLLDKNKNVFNLEEFGQKNNFITDNTGFFGWMVPNGEYYLQITKEEYNDRLAPLFVINNNIVNTDVNLIKKVKKLEEVIDPNASLTENISNVTQNLVAKVGELGAKTGQVVSDVVDNPEVEKISRRVVAPVTTGVVAVSTFSFISFSNLLPFLRLLFLQPLLLLGYRKREKWGQVYNALSKLPVDLAVVRLLDAESNKVVQTKVTDKEGRYAFVVEPGKYKIEVQKANFSFPSNLLLGYKSDGRRPDIYHGEIIEVKEDDSTITVNIPLDVVGEKTKKPKRLVWQKIGRVLQSVISILGFIITLISLYISPVWYIWVLLFIHIIFFLFFRRLAKPIKPKGWGIVYDSKNKKPVARAIARLFDAKWNKLVSFQVTDRKGRYYFLAGDNKYYVTIEHPDYDLHKTNEVDLTNKEADTIAIDVNLKKNSKNSDKNKK